MHPFIHAGLPAKRYEPFRNCAWRAALDARNDAKNRTPTTHPRRASDAPAKAPSSLSLEARVAFCADAKAPDDLWRADRAAFDARCGLRDDADV